MTYTLILTIVLTAGQYNALAGDSTVTAIDGFATNEQCVSAANRWLAQVRTGKSNVIRERAMAMCVAKGRP